MVHMTSNMTSVTDVIEVDITSLTRSALITALRSNRKIHHPHPCVICMQCKQPSLAEAVRSYSSHVRLSIKNHLFTRIGTGLHAIYLMISRY